jgi:serine phosphatase RsbU (regulator of sigma subunit)
MVYTDGLFEAETAEGEAFGVERMLAGISSRASEPWPMVFDGLMGDLQKFLKVEAGVPHADDICMVSVRFP